MGGGGEEEERRRRGGGEAPVWQRKTRTPHRDVGKKQPLISQTTHLTFSRKRLRRVLLRKAAASLHLHSFASHNTQSKKTHESSQFGGVFVCGHILNFRCAPRARQSCYCRLYSVPSTHFWGKGHEKLQNTMKNDGKVCQCSSRLTHEHQKNPKM